VAEKLRAAAPPVIGRVAEERLWLEVRTLLDGDDEAILEAVEKLYG
jgi:seryl-tRNA(Sec) selenium transferase